MWDILLTFLVLGTALFFLIKQIKKKFQNGGCGCGSPSCSSKASSGCSYCSRTGTQLPNFSDINLQKASNKADKE